jgi:hypothetical protein
MKRLLFMLSVALVASIGASVSPGVAPAADAASCVYITKVYFDSPGSDTGSNTSLNAEWIRLKNRCTTNKSLSSWRIKDKAGHAYTFGTFTLKAGYTVTVHTGKGTNTTSNRYWGQGWYIWNNTGDSAYLRNSAGTLIDSCTFSGAGDYAVC